MDILEKTVSSKTFIYKNFNSKNQLITYFSRESIFGNFLTAFTQENQLCYLKFFNSDKTLCIENLKKMFLNSTFQENSNFEIPNQLELVFKGTEFQITVWNELLNIKKGSTVSYEYVANSIGKPQSIRAVANAIGKNPISYLVPCHRVIRKNETIGGYTGGLDRKILMLKYEGINRF